MVRCKRRRLSWQSWNVTIHHITHTSSVTEPDRTCRLITQKDVAPSMTDRTPPLRSRPCYLSDTARNIAAMKVLLCLFSVVPARLVTVDLLRASEDKKAAP